MVYRYNKFSYKVPAQVVGEHFEKIEKKYGEVNREKVLDSARPAKSPIHELFEWDDSIAAEQYRLTQAGLLITNLDVEIETEETEPVIVRAYMNVSETTKGTFINVNSAFQSEDTKAIVLRRAYQEMQTFRRKYSELIELSAIFAVIDDFIKEKCP